MKIQDLVAIVGGFLSIMIIVGRYFIGFISNYLIEIELLNVFFENVPSLGNKEKKMDKIKNISNDCNFYTKHHINTIRYQPEEDKNKENIPNINLKTTPIKIECFNFNLSANDKDKDIDRDRDSFSKNKNVENKNLNRISLSKIENMNSDFILRSQSFNDYQINNISLRKIPELNVNLNDRQNNFQKINRTKSIDKGKIKDILSSQDKKTINYDLSFILKTSLCLIKPNITRKDDEKTFFYLFMRKYLREKMEVKNYLKSFDKFDCLSKLFLNMNQQCALEVGKKINICNFEEMNKFTNSDDS